MSKWKESKLEEIGIDITGKISSAKRLKDRGNKILPATLSDYCNYNRYANNSERKLSSGDIDKLKNKDLPPDEFVKLNKHIVSQDTSKILRINIVDMLHENKE